MSISCRFSAIASPVQLDLVDRIDIATFYPLLACLVDLAHLASGIPIHPAYRHQIISDVNPGSHPCALPDGSAAKLVILGRPFDESEHNPNDKTWWPDAHSLNVMSKLMRRIHREGFVLPILMSVCLAIMFEFYTTPVEGGPTKRSIRLRYRSSPISDFGICVGSADVKNQDKLAYFLPDGEILKGQDPDEHYWIYFRTVRGEEVVLDCSMFTFNMCLCVTAPLYMPHYASIIPPFAPAFFRDRVMQSSTPQLHKERHRVSILRNKALLDACEGMTVKPNIGSGAD